MEYTITFFIPFIFTFAIIFGVLEKVKIFPNKGVLAVIALAMAYFASTYQPYVTFLMAHMIELTWFFIAMFLLLFVLEVLGMRGKQRQKFFGEEIVINGVVLLLLLTVGLWLLGQTGFSLPFMTNDNLVLLLGLFLIIGMLATAFQFPPPPPPGKGKE